MRYARQRAIADLARSEVVSVEDLATRLGVSTATIRRDLAALSRAGLLTRVHGGAAPSTDSEIDRPFEVVADEASDAKAEIARAAAELVSDGDVVLLDIGTTTRALARRLRGREVTVITPSLAVLDELRDDETVEVVLLGGTVRRRYHSLVGTLTEEALRQVRGRIAFLGTSGVRGADVLDTTSVEVGTKRGLIAAAEEVVLLADHTKFPGRGSLRVCGLRDIDVLVTDAAPADDLRTLLDEHGTRVHHRSPQHELDSSTNPGRKR
jgi:DeoR/GlpR family transcriptional regulator of sugar metabolism